MIEIICPVCKKVFKKEEKELKDGGFEIEVLWIKEYGYCLEQCEGDLIFETKEEISLDKFK